MDGKLVKGMTFDDMVEYFKKHKPELIFDFQFMYDLGKACYALIGNVVKCDDCEYLTYAEACDGNSHHRVCKLSCREVFDGGCTHGRKKNR